MRSVFVLLLLVGAAVAGGSEYRESEDEDVSVEDLEVMTNMVQAINKAAGGDDNGRFRAPAIVPREGLNEFSRELDRIKQKLNRLVETLEPRVNKAKERVTRFRTEVDQLSSRAEDLRRQIREHIRFVKDKENGKYAKEHKALKKKLEAYKKSKEWLEALSGQVSDLKGGNPGSNGYETAFADITKSLAEHADLASKITGIDIVAELQELTHPRASFDADAASDLEVESVKMYETGRLRSLTARMRKSLDAKIAKVQAQIAELHKVKIPEHLHIGLRDTEDKLKRARKNLAKAKGRYSLARREDLPKVAAAKRELAKIQRIEGSLYTQK